MKALLTRSFSYLFKRGRTIFAGHSAQSAAVETFNFTGLNQYEQETVRQYFAASINLVLTVNAIRQRQVAVDVASVLSAFQLAERSFIQIGMRPIFPPALHCISSFDTARLINKGLLCRLGDAESPVLYSAAMVRHVTKLRAKYQPRELDSTSYNPMA
jgi:hypothetical protein